MVLGLILSEAEDLKLQQMSDTTITIYLTNENDGTNVSDPSSSFATFQHGDQSGQHTFINAPVAALLNGHQRHPYCKKSACAVLTKSWQHLKAQEQGMTMLHECKRGDLFDCKCAVELKASWHKLYTCLADPGAGSNLAWSGATEPSAPFFKLTYRLCPAENAEMECHTAERLKREIVKPISSP